MQALIASNRLKAVLDSFRTEKLLSELSEYNITLENLRAMHRVGAIFSLCVVKRAC